MSTKTAIVTGASGFIGRVLCRVLLKRGYSVFGVSRNPSPVLQQLSENPKFQVIHADLVRDRLPKSVLKRADVIFHLAGLAHTGKEVPISEARYRALNVGASKSIFKQGAELGLKRFVFFSSVKAMEADDVYGRSKQEAEQSLLALAKDFETELVILRPALVYGPDLKGNLHQMQQGIQGGWFPKIPETGNQRSLISVQDLVAAACVVAEHPDTLDAKAYVLTDGQAYSTRQIYDVLCHTLGHGPGFWTLPIRAFHLGLKILGRLDLYEKLFGSALYADPSLPSLTQDTGWVPQLRLSSFRQWQDPAFLL